MAPDLGQRSAAVRGLVAALLGGVIGWIAVFSGLGVWGLVTGLVATAVVILGLAHPGRARSRVSATAAYAFAFIPPTWPLLWLLVGYIRYAITGESLGD